MTNNRTLERLNTGWDAKRFICIGLDPDPERRPPEADQSQEAILTDCYRRCMASIEASGGRALAFDGPMGSTVPLYQLVAHNIATKWNGRGNCGLVVGATYPGELAQVRAIVGNLPILAPGVGTQGGDVAATMRNGITPNGRGLIVNSSSGIMYAADPSEAFKHLDAQAVAALSA